MSSKYHKVGTNYRAYFQYVTGPASFATGKTSGNFSIKITKNTTGNQATTGCTLTEVDSSNNPGEYVIDCSGSTSFASATGSYDIVVYDTSDYTQIWGETVVVTSDGTGAGSWGDASFTATASDGRIYDGAAAVSGATIYITNSSNVLYVKTTSDASGLWGPIYFNTNGTYTISVQKSGYTVASGTITVSGSTATGPGADLTITLSSTSSTLLVSTLQAYLARQMLNATGTQFDTVSYEIINEAMDMLSMERQWEYYHSYGAIQTQAPYSTGTVTIANGSTTCTLASGTFPTWAASGELYITSLGVWARISTRDSATQVTLEEAWGEATVTAVDYSLVQYKYTLPSDCARMEITAQGAYWPFNGRATSFPYLQSVKERLNISGAAHTMWCIEKASICIWPIPDSTKQISLYYFRKPAAVTSPSDTVDWDVLQRLVLYRALDYIAAARGATVFGGDEESRRAQIKIAKENYEDALSKAYSWDKSAADPQAGDLGGYYDQLRGPVT